MSEKSRSPFVNLIKKSVGLPTGSAGCCGPATVVAGESACCGTAPTKVSDSTCCGTGAAKTQQSGSCCG